MTAWADGDTFTASNGTGPRTPFQITNDRTGQTFGGFCASANRPWGQNPGQYSLFAIDDPVLVAEAMNVSEAGLAKIRYAIAEMYSNYEGNNFSIQNALISFPEDTLNLGRPLDKMLTQYLLWAQQSIDSGGPGYVDFEPTADEQAYFYRDILQLTDTLGIDLIAPNGYALDANGFMGPFTLEYSAGSAASLIEINNLGRDKDILPSFRVQIPGTAFLSDRNDGTGNIFNTVQLGEQFYIQPRVSGSYTINLVPQSTIITGIQHEMIFSAGAAFQPLFSLEFDSFEHISFSYEKEGSGFGLAKDVIEFNGSVTGDYAPQIEIDPDREALFRVEVVAELGGMNLFFGTPPTTSSDGYTYIYTPSQLAEVANDLSGNYRLMNNIDMTTYCLLNSGMSPIGNSANPFTGIFDGNGYTISGVTIDLLESFEVGLFGVSTGTIQDLAVSNFTITGRQNVGAIVGRLEGGTVTNCTVSASTINGYRNTGGAIGEAIATTLTPLVNITVDQGTVITNSTFRGGGVVGNTSLYELQNLRADNITVIIDPPEGMAEVTSAGGIAGAVYNGSIFDCISNNVTIYCTKGTSGLFSEHQSYNSEVGGIVGRWYRTIPPNVQITRCTVTGLDLSAWMGVGGVAGVMLSSGTAIGGPTMGITNCYVSDDSRLHVYGMGYGFGGGSNSFFYIYSQGGILGGYYRDAGGARIEFCYTGAQLTQGPNAASIRRENAWLGSAQWETSIVVINNQDSGVPEFPTGPTDPAAVGSNVIAAGADALWASGTLDGYITDVYTEMPTDGGTTTTQLTTADMVINVGGTLIPLNTLSTVGDGETIMIDVAEAIPFLFYFKTAPLAPGEYINTVTLNGRSETAKVIVRDEPIEPDDTRYYIDVIKYANGIQDLLDGAEFTLYQYSGADWTGTLTPVATITPNSNDRFEMTVPGWYALYEATTPPGFIADETYYNFRFTGTGFIDDAGRAPNGNWFSHRLANEEGVSTQTFVLSSVNRSTPAEPGTGSIILTGTKVVEGGDLTQGLFQFTVMEGDTVVATGSNFYNGAIGFTRIDYTQPGDHVYIVSEDAPPSGWTANTAPITIYVRVTDPGDDAELVVGVYSDPEYTIPVGDLYAHLTFENTYSPDPIDGELILTGTKVVEGGDLEAGLFRFTVTENGTPVATGTNDGSGAITFTRITYTQPGDHIYVISEDTPPSGWKINTIPMAIYVRVTDPGDGTELIATVYSDDLYTDEISDIAGHLTFSNTYAPGSLFPEAGGIGTNIFYVVGIMMAVVLSFFYVGNLMCGDKDLESVYEKARSKKQAVREMF